MKPAETATQLRVCLGDHSSGTLDDKRKVTPKSCATTGANSSRLNEMEYKHNLTYLRRTARESKPQLLRQNTLHI